MKYSIPGLLVTMCSVLFLAQACTKSTNLSETSAPSMGDGEADLQATYQHIADIPIPSGTTIDAQTSLILGGGDQWTGRLVLTLNQSHSEAFTLYTTQMPQFGWEAIASVQAETSFLTFVRGDRVATVEIIEGRAIRGCLVRITMAPQATNN